MTAATYKKDTTSAIVSRQDWERAKDILTVAAGLEAKERTRIIEARFPNEPTLRGGLLSMLEVHDKITPTLSALAETQPASPVEEAIRAGTLYGPYRVVRLIGAGGMGRVFLAQDTRLGRRVALKSLAGSWLKSSTARHRLLREARTAAALSHPHIATLYDILENDESLLLVMEYVEGRTAAALTAEAPMPLGHAVRLTIQIGEALIYAHDRGIIHCDLKPSNVQVSPDGSAKVLDFGLARARYDGDEVEPDAASHEMLLVGTLPYMPPERLLNGTLNVSGDIYSLGVTLFEMATGHLPFEERESVTLIGAIIGTDAPAASSVAPGVPACLDRVLAQVLAKDPKERPHTARQFCRDLQEVLGVLDGESTAGPFQSVASQQSARFYWRALFGASVTIATVIALTFIGFITSTVYTSHLGLTMSFEGESPLFWPVWGLRSLILPLGQILEALLIFGVATQLWRIVVASVRPLRRCYESVLARLTKLIGSVDAIPIRALAGALLIAHVLALSLVWWRFRELIESFSNFVMNSGSLAVLSPAYGEEHKLYMRGFSLLVLGFGWGWYRLLRTKLRVLQPISATTLAAGAAVMVVTFFLMTAPYRLFFQSKGERVLYQSQPCYLVGKSGNNAMLFCRTQEPPWSRLVNLNDPALKHTGSRESIFSIISMNEPKSQKIP